MWHSQTQHFLCSRYLLFVNFGKPLASAKSAKNLYRNAKISPKRFHWLEKSTPPPVLAVLTYISYCVHIVWLEDMSFVIQKYCAFVLIKKCTSWSWNKLQQQNFKMKVWSCVRIAYSVAEIEIKHELSFSKINSVLILNWPNVGWALHLAREGCPYLTWSIMEIFLSFIKP